MENSSNLKKINKTVQVDVQIISHASKVMLKILQARLQQYVTRELPDVQAGFNTCISVADSF